jgi:hypothetical protein
MTTQTSRWVALVDDAVHEINMRWGNALDDSDEPDTEPMEQIMVRETAEAILRPLFADQFSAEELAIIAEALRGIRELLTHTPAGGCTSVDTLRDLEIKAASLAFLDVSRDD